MELKPLFLFNTSKNNDAAFDFATYVCGKEWQQAFTPAHLRVPM